MNGTIFRRAAARPDLVDIFVFLSRHSGPVAHRFLESAERTFQRLLESPGLGGLADFGEADLATLRVFPVRDFRNYPIFYRPVEGGIEIVRVLHGSRDIEALLTVPE
jgi:toxin ParE1/3/4